MTDQTEQQTKLDRPEILDHALAGGMVAVICRGQFDAREKAEAFVQKHCRDIGRVSRGVGGTSIYFGESGGIIEFVWIHSNSGRRADDFEDKVFDLDPKAPVVEPGRPVVWRMLW